VITLTRSLAVEYGRRNIRANVMALGWFETTPGAGPNDPQENRLLRYIPMRRFGKPEEAGPLAVYLCSDSAGYLNGQIYTVDGGVLARL
jgi:NAD(P)-dependent dehydrogenase (short-subunit alcohol dehydrogenase family)